MFLALFGICVGNSYTAFKRSVKDCTFMDFKIALSEQLINNMWLEREEASDDEA